MKKKQVIKTPEWREFEKLVVRIEQTVAPHGVVVRSPDRIRSLLTNRLREVDASIRAKIGTAEILISVECRKRVANQDVTWLEQLASKKQALGIARTIAVSSSEFSADAIRAAEHYGIDLRVVREITTQEIENWLFPTSLIHLYKHSKLLAPPNVEFKMLPGETVADYRDDEENLPLSKLDINSPVFCRRSTGNKQTLNEIWSKAELQTGLYKRIPGDGSITKVELDLEMPDDYEIETSLGPRLVKRINLKCALSWQKEEILISEAKLVEYSPARGETSATIRRAEFQTKKASKNNLRIGLQVEGESRKMRFSVQLANSEDNKG